MKMETAANDDVPVKEIFPELTRDVIDRMKNSGNPRLREVLALVVQACPCHRAGSGDHP